MRREGEFNIYALHSELSALMISHCTVWRRNEDLCATINQIKEIREKLRHISLDDRSRFANQGYIFANQLHAMLELSLAIAKGALLRDESRGSHHKRAFPKRDDENWLRISIAKWQSDEPDFSFRQPDTRH